MPQDEHHISNDLILQRHRRANLTSRLGTSLWGSEEGPTFIHRERQFFFLGKRKSGYQLRRVKCVNASVTEIQ